MANCGKFSDRFPTIKAAGVTRYNPELRMEYIFNDMSLEFELIDRLTLMKSKKEPRYIKKEQKKTSISSSQVKDLINPPMSSIFESMIDELKETAYKSYWNKDLGKIPDQVPGLPVGMDPENTVFGKPSPLDPISGSELINPKKFSKKVEEEAKIGHGNYKISHHDYYPGEQIDRKYINPPLNKNLFWGMRTLQKKDGSKMKKVLQWFDQNKVSTTSKKQSLNRALHHHEMGKTFSPNRNIEKVPKGFSFGKTTRGNGVGVAGLMKSNGNQDEIVKLSNCFSYINGLRLKLSHMDPPFPFYEFAQEFKHIDLNSCGCLPLPDIYKVCGIYKVPINKELMETLLKLTNILHNNNKIQYLEFISLLNSKLEFPTLTKIQDLPKESLHFETTYQAFGKDLTQKIEKGSIHSAGLSNLREDKIYPLIFKTKLDATELIGETTADTLLRPSIFTQYGVSHRDLFWPRTKVFIKNIFEKIGTKIPEETFELLWEEGKKRDKAGERVSVETFRNLLDEVTAAKLAQLSSQ